MRLDRNGAQEFLGAIFGELIFHISSLKENMAGVTPQIYAQSRLVRDALAMRLQAIGELIKRISGKNTDEFGLKESYPDFPWDDFKGMRNHLAHAYAQAEISYPWEAWAETIPELEQIISHVCEDYPRVKNSMSTTLATLEYGEERSISRYRALHSVPSDKH